MIFLVKMCQSKSLRTMSDNLVPDCCTVEMYRIISHRALSLTVMPTPVCFFINGYGTDSIMLLKCDHAF